MASQIYDIEQIERYLSLEMSDDEQAAYEARLSDDEGLRREVAAYEQAFKGLAAAQTLEWINKMEEWEVELKPSDDTELIEWYLKGELERPGQQVVEKRMADNPSFHKEVDAYRQLLGGFDAAGGEAFSQQMEEWENKRTPTLRPWIIRLAAAAAILLLIGLGINGYLHNNYSSSAIATEYYRAPLGENTLGDGPLSQATIGRQFQEADALFQSGQYPAAYEAFDNLLAQLPGAQLDDFKGTYYRSQAEWSRLLAAIAMEDPPIDVEAECERIANSAGHEYQLEAVGLQQKFQSPWYRWVN